MTVLWLESQYSYNMKIGAIWHCSGHIYIDFPAKFQLSEVEKPLPWQKKQNMFFSVHVNWSFLGTTLKNDQRQIGHSSRMGNCSFMTNCSFSKNDHKNPEVQKSRSASSKITLQSCQLQKLSAGLPVQLVYRLLPYFGIFKIRVLVP